MHIKKIVIQGFKTYKEATVIDILSPKNNVVVGRNGSGKSNFFAAIRFVLSDAYTQMSREERRGLIHEGSGTVMSAYVEIVFDNTDRRFPIDKAEVVVRRTIGLKKDDYSINSKSAQRSDVMNLLESAGFSRSNPYYIVPQGRITGLTNAKDFERLQLLKEVAGAQVFEQKLKQSLKEMAVSNKQQEKIDEMLTFIEERLNDLSTEKEELKQFQELERDRKFLEYTLYDREMSEIDEQIESIDVEHSEEIDESSVYLNDLEKKEEATLQLEEVLVELKSRLNVLKVDKTQSAIDLNDLVQELTRQQEIVKDLQMQSSMNLKVSKSKYDLSKELEADISSKEQFVTTQQPILKELEEAENTLKKELNDLNDKQRTLYVKENRQSQFETKKQRDDWLKDNIHQMQVKIDEKKGELETNKANQQQLQDKNKDLDKQISELQDEINGEQAKKISNELYTKISQTKSRYSELIDERKLLWRNEARQRILVDSSLEELRKADRYVGETMDRAQSSGLEAVKRITERLGLVGVYGPLGELIEVNPKYKTAAEVIAGNALFHVVVDNDNTASTVMEELVREKSGRVTFIPLNRINPKDQQYPDRTDCVPLIKKIAFDDQFAPAVKQVYGKAVVAMSLDVGASLAREYGLSAITLDGDRADRRGVLTGGYRDHKRSRIDSLAVQRRRKHEYDEGKSILHELKRQVEAIDQRITAANSEIASSQRKYDALMLSKEPLKIKLAALQSERSRNSKELVSSTALIDSLEKIINQYEKQNLNYKQELESEFQKGLTAAEINILNNLQSQISECENRLSQQMAARAEKELQISEIQSVLREKLYPQREQLLLTEDTENVFDNELHQAQEKLHNLENSVKELSSKVEQTSKELDEVTKEVEQKEKLQAKLSDNKRSLSKKLSSFQKTAERKISKKSLLVNRRDDVQRKIRELGVLPEIAFTKYTDLDSETLLRNLNAVNKNLTKYSHINRKALEQYLNFSKQRDELMERRKESDKSRASIENLIQVLERRKSNAINRTFAQLSEEFSKIFEKLVPAGVGKLVMQKKLSSGKESISLTQQIRTDEDGDDIIISSDEEEDQGDNNIDNYSGVSISVSFNSKSDEQQRIEQLSGGQKSLCAIALILAIQKCDPAPFYLFDEIDANLDTQYRTAVASLIEELSLNAQFICTTFRPELLQVADKYYGIMYSNKISKVTEITKDEAMTFIEGQQQRP